MKLSKHLFWDIDLDTLNYEEHGVFIVQRVLTYGLEEDWIAILTYYGLDKISELAKEARNLDDRSLAFIAALTGSSYEEFRCYTTKPSTMQPFVS
jgi:hypothetical protein